MEEGDRDSVQEIRLDGQILRRYVAPQWSAILGVSGSDLILDAATSDGLSMEVCRSPGCRHRLWLWDAENQQRLRTFGSDNPFVLAAGKDLIAWNEVGIGPGQQKANIFDARSGEETVAQPDGVAQVCCGEFSPDELTLAAFAHRRPGRPLIVLVDTVSGETRFVEGSRGASTEPTWSSTGEWLFFGLRPNGEGAATRVGAYRVGTRSAFVLDVRVEAGFRRIIAN